ncbi:hypothetical protein DBR42_12975 [Pelomonas sp. HMWF004]|nr:hypothetical protein DBR42_12975 [Pelomonas sp. HMWF004]
MGSLIVVVLAYTVLVVLPFKLAASWLGTDRSDWVSCFVAVLVAGALGGGVSGLFGGGMGWAFFGATQGILLLAIVALISGLTNNLNP